MPRRKGRGKYDIQVPDHMKRAAVHGHKAGVKQVALETALKGALLGAAALAGHQLRKRVRKRR